MHSSGYLPAPPAFENLLLREHLSLFLDFDGTLVEIAPSPDAIAVRADLPCALESLSRRVDGRLALVSGRSLEDLARYLGDSLPIAQAGSHGVARRLADGSPLGTPPKALADDVVSALTEFAAVEGLNYEAKPHGGALHYREKPEAAEMVHRFALRIAQDHDLAIKTGKCVIERVRRGAEKGAAVRAFMETSPFAGSIPVFVGDDVTDEDGFTACEALGGFGILVGKSRATAARYRLASVGEVHQWLGL